MQLDRAYQRILPGAKIFFQKMLAIGGGGIFPDIKKRVKIFFQIAPSAPPPLIGPAVRVQTNEIQCKQCK